MTIVGIINYYHSTVDIHNGLQITQRAQFESSEEILRAKRSLFQPALSFFVEIVTSPGTSILLTNNNSNRLKHV